MASRWPQRFFLAAFISRSTSASVRYSRVRSLLLGGRCGGDCSIYGGWRDQPEVPFGHALRAPSVMTVRIMPLLRTVDREAR